MEKGLPLSETYVMADPHMDREGGNTVGRPFADTAEMSREIVAQVNSRVRRQDRLIIVGDFSFRDPVYYRGQLRCNAILCVGNHDNWQKSSTAFGKFRQNIYQHYDGKLCGHRTFFCHYPTMYWPASHYGAFHCFGHVHDQRTETIETAFPGIRAMDVGVDAAFRLLGKYTCFHEKEIYDILIQRPGHDPVEWYKERRGEYKKDHDSAE